MLERRLCQESPERYEYVLTERGSDFGELLVALVAQGNKHLAPGPEHRLLRPGEQLVGGPSLRRSGERAAAVPPSLCIVAGPAADETAGRAGHR